MPGVLQIAEIQSENNVNVAIIRKYGILRFFNPRKTFSQNFDVDLIYFPTFSLSFIARQRAINAALNVASAAVPKEITSIIWLIEILFYEKY